MNISELIAELESMQKSHGNVQVAIDAYDGDDGMKKLRGIYFDERADRVALKAEEFWRGQP